jgi:putative membrane protein
LLHKISGFVGMIAISVTQPLSSAAQVVTNPDAPQPQQLPHSHGHWHMWGDHPGWHLWWVPLMMILFFVLCFGAMRFSRFDRRRDMMHWSSRGTSSSAIEILNERFAKGEIEEDEYMDKKAKILSA